MTIKMRVGVAAGIVVGLSLLMCYCNGLWPLSAAAIDSVVVDAKTKRPVEGAIVVAYWELKQGSMAGDSLPCAAANVEEAVTDGQGRFHLPGWGPTLPVCSTRMSASAPLMYVYKQGYYYGKYDNVPSYGMTTTHTPGSWHPQLSLEKIPDDELTRTDLKDVNSGMSNFDQLGGELSMFSLFMPGQCNWKKMPNMVRALEAQRRSISQSLHVEINGLTGDLIAHDEEFRRVAPQCGSTRAFIEALMK